MTTLYTVPETAQQYFPAYIETRHTVQIIHALFRFLLEMFEII